MTNISAWHVIDRFSACIMMLLELIKLATMRPFTRPAIYILYIVSCGIAMLCFLKGQESLQLLSEDGFVFWHSGWHCYPIIASIVHLIEYALNQRWGEYYKFGCDEAAADNEGCGGHPKRCEMDDTYLYNSDVSIESQSAAATSSEREGDSFEVQRVFASSVTNVSSAVLPASRQSRRIARMKPENLRCL